VANRFCRLQGKRLVCPLLHIPERQLSHEFFRLRDRTRRHTEFLHSQPDQYWQSLAIRSQFTAHAHPFSGGFGALHHLANLDQDCRVQSILEIGDRCIAPLGGKGILRQIVGSDTEKINLRRKDMRQQSRRRHFNHHTDIHVIGNRHTPVPQFGDGFVQDAARAPPLANIGDHGNHDSYPMTSGSTQDSAQLRFEQIGTFQTQPDGALPQKWILFARHMKIRQRLIAPHIQRADDNRPLIHQTGYGMIRLKLLILIGRRRSIKKEKFSAQQSNPVGAVRQRCTRIFEIADIRRDLDTDPVFRHGMAQHSTSERAHM
jgi:hypothetical protein